MAVLKEQEKSGRSPKSRHGIPKVESDKGTLRIRFTDPITRKRKAFALGMPDDEAGRDFAQRIVLQMKADINAGRFDSSLKEYKPKRLGRKVVDSVTPSELFAQYMNEQVRAKGLAKGSLDRYKGTLSHLKKRFERKSVEFVTEESAYKFTAYLNKLVGDRTVKDYLQLVKSCWEWAREKELISFDVNPWSAALINHKVEPKQKVKPFTVEEVQRILGAFRQETALIQRGDKTYQVDNPYRHYADFVAFLFGVGCRFGEAAGLKWKHVSADCTKVWIGESVSRGVRGTTKTGRSRDVELSPQISQMLKARRPQFFDPESLVFPAPKGNAINDNNFSKRAWKTVLGQLGIEYRKLYATRHTTASHALASGANYLDVADALGHNPQVLHRNYASVIERKSVFVEF